MENGSLAGLEKWFIETTQAPQFKQVNQPFHYAIRNKLRDFERGQAEYPHSLLEIAKWQAKRELDDRA
jgi:hypothetical protein